MSYGIPRHACSCEHGHDMDYPPCPRCAAAGQPPLTDEELSRLEAVVAGKPILTRLLAGFLDAQELLAEQLAALEALRNEIEVRVTLHMGTAEEIEEKIDACERLADGGEFRKTLVTEILRVRAHCDALADENDRLAVREGHGQPCYYCSAACDSGAGDPGRWPIPLPHAEEPGVVKWHHAGCVASRLREHGQARALADLRTEETVRLHDRIRELEEEAAVGRAEIKALRARVDLVEKRTAVPPPREVP